MSYSWLILFTGALLDALIGPNLIFPGEPFLLSAGYQLYSGIKSGVIAVCLGGFLGDQLSYWIGRRYGRSAQKKLIKWKPSLSRLFARTKYFFQKHGNKALVFARLLGPIAWIVPFIAGTQQISWQRFSLFATIGLVFGIGQFILWGYLLAFGINQIPLLAVVQSFLQHHFISILIVASCLLFLLKRLLKQSDNK